MTLAELRTEFSDRGFAHISTTRANRWLNQAYQEICEEADFPFLEATAVGTPPLTISDLRSVLYVTDSTNDNVLKGIDQRTIQDWDPDAATTGAPDRWYLTGTGTVNVWPVSTSISLTVKYLKVVAELSADSSEPVVPARFQNLIIDGAVIRAYRNADEGDKAQQLRTDWQEGISRMMASLLSRNRQNPELIIDTALERNR